MPTEEIERALDSFLNGNIGDATTGRTDLTKEHFEYFLELPILKQLFGGTLANVVFVSPELTALAHNEYVDMLLNVGVLGAIVLLGFIVGRTVEYFIKYRKTRNEEYLCFVMNKFIWLTYAATLTFFLDYRFLLLYFL